MRKRNPQKRKQLVDEIARTINRCSAEGGSDTPDFILAEYLVGCLEAFEHATTSRDRWRGTIRVEELTTGPPLKIDPASIARAVPHSKAIRDIKAKRAASRSSRSRRSG